MIEIMDEQENYLMVTDGADFTVLERRAGKFTGFTRAPATEWRSTTQVWWDAFMRAGRIPSARRATCLARSQRNGGNCLNTLGEAPWPANRVSGVQPSWSTLSYHTRCARLTTTSSSASATRD